MEESMADEIKKSNIKIKSAEDTGPQIKLRDQNNRTYSFFKNKKDGDATVAFLNYQNFKVADEVEISFREVPYNGIVIRNITSMRPATAPVEAPVSNTAVTKQRAPGQEYWERREEKRQSSILVQVAFKAALELQSAYINSGREEDREKLYNDAMEFYDWMDFQIGEEVGEIKKSDFTLDTNQQAEPRSGVVNDEPDF